MASIIPEKSTLRSPLAVRNPRTGEIDLHITPASAEEIAAICAKLRQAQESWGTRAARLSHRCVEPVGG